MMKKILNAVIFYITGTLSGMFVKYGFGTYVGRSGNVGGEVLIIPLMIMLIYCGFSVSKFWYTEGYSYFNIYRKERK